MKVTFTKTRVYGDGIGLKHAGESADVTKEQKEQFLSQGLIERDTVKKQVEKQAAKPATTSQEE